MEFPESAGILNGTLRYFQRENTTNYNAIAKASSILKGRDPMSLLQDTDHSSFITETSSTQKQYVTIELKHSIISITSYSIRSPAHLANDYPHLKSWRFLGSIDKHTWDLLDEHNDTDVLNSPMSIHNFNCSLSYKGLYRFFRVQQTGVGFTGSYGFGINCFELFGTLYLSKYVPLFKHCTVNRHSSFISNVLI